jgi:DnaK suppressor protein
MHRTNDLRRLSRILEERRRNLVRTTEGAREELRALKNQERDPEYEENAQSELADYTLSHLLETQRREVMLIDAALERMKNGIFGECVDCGMEIPFERLLALPFALRCEEDARRQERERHGGGYALPSL